MFSCFIVFCPFPCFTPRPLLMLVQVFLSPFLCCTESHCVDLNQASSMREYPGLFQYIVITNSAAINIFLFLPKISKDIFGLSVEVGYLSPRVKNVYVASSDGVRFHSCKQFMREPHSSQPCLFHFM